MITSAFVIFSPLIHRRADSHCQTSASQAFFTLIIDAAIFSAFCFTISLDAFSLRRACRRYAAISPPPPPAASPASVVFRRFSFVADGRSHLRFAAGHE